MKQGKIGIGFVIKGTMIGLGLTVMVLTIWIWAGSFHPAQMQSEPVVCADDAPTLKPGQSLKVLTYNVRYMAGVRYVPLDTSSNESSQTQIRVTPIKDIARIIRAENPDIIFFQEVSEPNYQDQLADLLSLLPTEYACHSSAFIQKIRFMPTHIRHVQVMKLSTVSKYQISQATRHQLALDPADDFITQQLGGKRAVLEVRLPAQDSQELVVLNTHLSPIIAQGTDLMQKQVTQVDFLLRDLTQANTPWIIGGDFNLLPPDQYSQLPEAEKIYYEPDTELKVLFDKYPLVPGLANVSGPDPQRWFTYLPDDARFIGPDSTIDYIFYSESIQLTDAYVRQHDTLAASDHLPVVAEFRLP